MLSKKIEKLKDELKATIMAHNYQLPEVQDIADFVGDSLELAKESMKSDSRYIVLAGVDFMAETAAILNPEKVVFIPSNIAGCEMAHFLEADTIVDYRRRYPDAKVVLYVNSTAECKAVSDVICTSANAAKIVEAVDSNKVLFGPDANLAKYVAERTSKTVIPIPARGHCYVHTNFDPEKILEMKRKDDGEVMAHPECVKEVRDIADVIAGTGGMIKHVANSQARRFIVATECDMTHRLKKLYPDREFTPAWDNAICLGMKQTTLQSIWQSLTYKRYVVHVEEKVAEKAKKAIERMFELTQ
ncbi:MAG: quinolinate synthase NadA [Nitrososphaeria archaeon]